MGRSKTIVELNAHRLRRLNDQLLKVGLVESERAAFIQSATLTKKGGARRRAGQGCRDDDEEGCENDSKDGGSGDGADGDGRVGGLGGHA